MQKIKITLIIIVGLLIAFLVIDIGKDTMNDDNIYLSDTERNVLRDTLTKEFQGAYVSDEEETTDFVEYTLVADESSLEIIDGVMTNVWAYNKMVPGPTFRIKKGQGIRVIFTNNLPQETTIHWHGMRVPNAMDGVPGVTQEPIKPGETFVYEFIPKDVGTFWYHPHVRSSEQVERGLYGVLIVEDTEHSFDNDVTVVLDDWRLASNAQISEGFNSMQDLMHDGRWGNVVTANSDIFPKIKMKAGSQILLRLINPSNARVYRPDFGELNAIVIAIDGMYVKEPFPYTTFDLASGNRLDVVLTIPTKVDSVYVISDIFTRNTISLFKIISEDKDKKNVISTLPKNEKVPDWTSAMQMPYDALYVLDARRGSGGMGMMGGGDTGFPIEWTINGKTFAESDPIVLKKDVFQKIRFRNDSSRLHPMHLHGQFFKVISRNGEPSGENFFRDTVLIYPNETVDVGIVPLDEGLWISHCHILEHAESGMMITVSVE